MNIKDLRKVLEEDSISYKAKGLITRLLLDGDVNNIITKKRIM